MSGSRTRHAAPTFEIESDLWAAGHEVVVGIDEVGRGAWAGPLVVGAVVLRRGELLEGVRDSKLLSERSREALFEPIVEWCQDFSVGIASDAECDALGMAAAQHLATRRALDALGNVPDAAISDGSWDFISPLVGRVEMRVGADRICASVAASSVVAKVIRDRMMRALSIDYPWWSFESNKGYPCPVHRAALAGYGPSGIHRRSWSFMDNYVPWTGVSRRSRDLTPRLF